MSPPSSDPVLLSRDPQSNGVAVVTLNFPARRNAFGLAMREALLDALERLMHSDSACRAIVLTGAGGAFCSGGDISEMTERSVLGLRERNRLPLRVFELLADGPTPVVVAVEGPAMGAGLALAAVCDEVVASREARFCAAFVRVGLLPDTGLYWSLTQRVGAARAREMMMTAREVDAAEAASIGLVDEVVEPGGALAAACARARRYTAMPPLAVAHVRVALARGIGSLDQAIETEANLQPLLRRSRDHGEAVAAFMEKRSPSFLGS